MSRARLRRWTLAAGPRYRAPDLASIEGVAAAGTETRSATVTYYDTEDLRLARWGCRLCHGGDGWTLMLGRDGASGPQLVDREMHFAGTAAGPPDAAVDLVTGLTRGAPLHRVLRTRSETVHTSLATLDGDALADIVDERVTVLEGRRITSRFRDIHLTALRGGNHGHEHLIDAALALVRDAGAAVEDPAQSSARALGPAALHEADVVAPAMTRRSSAADAIRSAIAGSVARLILYDAAVRIGQDPEGVHQARVATRRLRSDLRTFRTLLDEAWTQRLRDDLHGLADQLGKVRDADVLLGRLSEAVASLPERDRPGAAPALAALSRSRDEARAELLHVLRSPGYTALLDELVAAAADPHTTPEAAGNAADLLPPLAATPWRRLRKRVSSLGDTPPDADLHQVRILAKRARYAAEAVAPVARRSVAAFARAVAAVQDQLGEHHDAVVAEAWLHGPGAAGADAFALGELVGLERARASRARAGWPRFWKAAKSAHPSKWA